MTNLEKRVNLAAVAIPFLAVIAAIVLLWNSAVSATDLAILAAMYVITGVGVTVGFHRLLTHRSFKTTPAVRGVLTALGSAAIELGRPRQGSVGPAWAAPSREGVT